MATVVLVTGGCGFLGSLIVDALREFHIDWTVYVLDQVRPANPKPGVTYMRGSVTEPCNVEDALQSARPTVIIHCAGLVPSLKHRFSRELESKVRNVNVTGTKNMLEAAKSHDIKAFIYTSSCTAVIDNVGRQYRNIDETYPTSIEHSLIYGESKALAEELVIAANAGTMATCALRPSVLCGPGDCQLIPPIHACIAKGETPFIIGPGDNMWDISYGPNIADAHILAVENLLGPSPTAAGEIFFIQNNEPLPFRDFCLAVWKDFDHYPSFEIKIPASLARFAGAAAELASWTIGATTTLSRGSVMDACATRYASGAKAKRLLGYTPRVGLEEGLKISCQDYKERLRKVAKINDHS